MSNKEIFCKKLDKILDDCPDLFGQDKEAKIAYEFYEQFKAGKTSTEITEKGAEILKYMQDNYETYNNIFTARSIGEGINKSSRIVSGALKKLVTDEFVSKLGENPVNYQITDKGINYKFDN